MGIRGERDNISWRVKLDPHPSHLPIPCLRRSSDSESPFYDKALLLIKVSHQFNTNLNNLIVVC